VATKSLMPAQSIKRRQYLLMGGVALIVIGAVAIGVAVTSSGKPVAIATSKPKTVQIMTPGSQVDPKDAWTATAGAEIRGLTEKNKTLENQNRDMLDRLKRLEGGRTNTAPSAVAVTTSDAPGAPPTSNPAISLPTPAPRSLNSSGPATMPAGTPPVLQPTGHTRSPLAGSTGAQPGSGLVTLALADPNKSQLVKTSSGVSQKPENKGAYLPAGAFARAVLLGGIDAPTGGQAQRNPQPVLMRLQDNAILPNRYRYAVKECFVVGAAYGDISSERAYIRTETLSCVTHAGEAIDIPLRGYVAGEDGKAGMRGRLVSKQGQILANALMAGIVSGIGQGFRDSATTTSVSPLGAVQSTQDGKEFEAGVASGVGKALDRLAQYYINLADKTFPVIEIDAARQVDVIVTKGVAIEGLESADEFSANADTE
jgi:conjugal transfer pilus assembly protein TraB